MTVLAANAVPTLSGTVSYSGSAVGRIYVTVQAWEGGATTMLVPGPFLIRGVALTAGQTVTVRAYRDTLGVGRFVAGADPAAEQTLLWNGTSLSGFVLGLVDPPALALSAPSGVNVQGADSGAIVGWQRISGGSGDNELAAYYHVYASTSSNPLGDAGSTIMRTIRGGTAEAALMGPLVNGTPYYFAVAGVRGGIEGPATIVGPITVGTVTPGVDISGTLSFTGQLPAGNLYAVINNQSRTFIARLDNPTSPQPSIIHGVPPGVYGTGALLDVGADGELGPTDLDDLPYRSVRQCDRRKLEHHGARPDIAQRRSSGERSDRPPCRRAGRNELRGRAARRLRPQSHRQGGGDVRSRHRGPHRPSDGRHRRFRLEHRTRRDVPNSR